MTITLKQYVGRWHDSPDWTDERIKNAQILLGCVNLLLDDLVRSGVILEDNPKTASLVSGEQYGGFRPQACNQGAPDSSHKVGRGIDIYDPSNKLDGAIDDLILARHGLYREHPDATLGWVHLTTRPPMSGKRTFKP